jgi:hypothetical protein
MLDPVAPPSPLILQANLGRCAVGVPSLVREAVRSAAIVNASGTTTLLDDDEEEAAIVARFGR